jgi:hypothetical protein
MGQEKLTIDDFVSFEDSASEVVSAEEISFETQTIIKEEEKEDLFEEENKELSDVELLENSDEIPFEDENIADFETIKDPVGKQTTPKTSSRLEALNLLKERGILEFEKEPENEAEALDLLEDAWENSFSTYVDDMVSNLPEEAKGLLKYVKEGGDAYDYLKTLKENAVSGINKKSDISKTEVQEQVMRMSVQSQGYDEDYIEDHIESLKESGKLEKYSKPVYDKIVKEQVEKEKNAVANLELSKKEKQESLKKEKKEFQEYLASTTSVKGFTITEKEKSELVTYMKEPLVQLDNGTVITSFQKELFEAAQDKETGVLLAKLLKSKFNFDSVKKEAITQKTKEIKKGLTESKEKRAVKSLFDRI